MGDREYVLETEEMVPFPLIDFEGEGDEAGKAIRAIIPNWNVPSAELKKFANGDYPVTGSMIGLEKHEIVPVVQFLGNCCKFASPEPSEHQRVKELWDDAETVVKRGQYQHWVQPRGVMYRVHYALRHTLTEKFLFNLLGKIRKLLAARPVEGTDTKADTKIDTKTDAEPDSSAGNGTETEMEGVETVPQKQYHPFEGFQDASDSLVQCLHYILLDYMSRGVEIDHPGRWNEDPWDALSCFNWASHWSMLYRYLRKEIETNGPVPEELRFFYGHVELGSRLERIHKYDFRKLRARQDEEHIKDLFQSIEDARKHYGCNYEGW